MKKTVLFDMDGTLTKARGQMDMNMASALATLQKKGYKIGIVSGSSMKYIREQCDIMWGMTPVDYRAIEYFPCNGTKHFRYSDTGKLNTVHEVSMEGKIGSEHFNRIVYYLFNDQSKMLYTLWGKKMPMTGNFIDCRGSMINWCPIGRNANNAQRSKWKELDKKHNIRNSSLTRIKNHPLFEDITIKLGGDTSFDIYPNGWDKTYVLNHFEGNDEIFFVGDRCNEHGNDKELYDYLNEQNAGSAFKTTGPIKTIEIIEQSILVCSA